MLIKVLNLKGWTVGNKATAAVGCRMSSVVDVCVCYARYWYITIMPLLQGQPFKLIKNPDDVDPSLTIYTIPHTGEQFLNSR